MQHTVINGHSDDALVAHGLTEFYTGQDYGIAIGHANGVSVGIAEGYSKGVDVGYETGYRDGWTNAVNKCNPEIDRGNAWAAQLIEEKNKLERDIIFQGIKISQLEGKLMALQRENEALDKADDAKAAKIEQQEAKTAQLERDNAALRGDVAGLRDMVGTLKEANFRLQSQVVELDSKLRAKTEECNGLIQQYSRTLVFVNAVRSVLENLTDSDSPDADRVRQLFANKYADRVSSFLGTKDITVPPDQDEAFAKQLPMTHAFIKEMLEAAKNLEAEPEPEHEEEVSQGSVP